MAQIDYGNPMERRLAELTCGEETLPQDNTVREVTRDCERAALAIEGALSRYCGCPCRHPDDPICSTNMLPEDRAALIPRTFSGFRPGDPDNLDPLLRPGMRDILAGTDAEFADSSFVHIFHYCPQEVPTAWDTLFREHRLPAPANPDTCTPQIEIDEDLLNRPSIMWIETGAAMGLLEGNNFPWRFELGLGGYAANGFFGGGEATFFVAPREGADAAYSAGFMAEVGYYHPFSSSAGLQIAAAFEVGGLWIDGGTDLFIRMGPQIDIFMWFLEGFAVSMGLGYMGRVMESPLNPHSLDLIIKLYFGIL